MTTRATDNGEGLFDQLHNLHMVAAVATFGSVSGAARELCRSPSVVTRGIAEVERFLGLDLFDRKPGLFAPNWHGQVVLKRVNRIEEEIATAIAELMRAKTSGSLPAASLRHLLSNGRKLLLLIHLADARSASGAAGTMAITQSGVSMALARFEDALGLRLFYRSLRGLSPTDPGARLILRARRIRAELRHALSELASVRGKPGGLVVVGALPLARTRILPRAIGACLDAAPQIQVEAVEAPGQTLVNQLSAGEIDVVLTVPGSEFDPRGLVVEPLFDDELVIVAGRDHPLAARRGLTLRDLETQPWILPWQQSLSRVAFEQRVQAAGLRALRPATQTADLALIRRLLIERSDMIALTSRMLLQHELETGVLVSLDVAMEPISRSVVMLRREAAMYPPAVLAMIDMIRSAVRAPDSR